MNLKHWQAIAANHIKESAEFTAWIAESKNISKPVVHFIGEPHFFNHLSRHDSVRARVNTLDHPVWGEDIVTTSFVIAIEDNGNFETLNTKYVGVDLLTADVRADMLLSA